MIAVDSSVAIAAFGDWLTGFPSPHRAAPGLVDRWLDDRFSVIRPPPGADEQRELVRPWRAKGAQAGRSTTLSWP